MSTVKFRMYGSGAEKGKKKKDYKFLLNHKKSYIYHLQGILAIPFLINFQDCTVVILRCDRDFAL
jgi:hypothetical protein